MGLQKWILPTALASSFAFLRGRTIAKDADRIVSVITPQIRGFNAEGFVVRLIVKLENPTKRDFDFTQPFLEIKYNGSVIGTSQASDKVTTFSAGGQDTFDPIDITIPWVKLLFLGIEVVKDLQSGKAGMVAEAKATSYTTIFWVYRKQVTYSQQITIRKEQTQ